MPLHFYFIFIACIFRLQGLLAQPIQSRVISFDTIYAFGDSYTDNFSLDQFYKQNLQHIDKNSTSSLFPDHVKRYTNGLLWIEDLAIQFNQATLYDFARSGATSNNSLIFRSTQDINMQITAYNQSDVIQETKSNAVYCFWIGVNDMDVLFQQHPDNSTERQYLFNQILDSIQYELTRLYDIGARHIVLMGLIPLQELPKYNTASIQADSRENLKQLVLDYNDRLIKIKHTWDQQYKDATMLFFNTYQQFYRLFDSDTITINTKTHCHQETDCDGYIWWDDLHPTTGTHQKIANAVSEAIRQTQW